MVKEGTTDDGAKRGHSGEAVTTVAPALPVQEHRLPLSNLDLILPPIDVGVFFCYADPVAGAAAVLKAALAKTLVAYYPLAGEVVANADGEPELLCSGRGVDVAEATAGDADMRDLRLGFPDESVEQLVPKKKAGVVSVQVTKFKCGGAVVGCTFDHRVCDAYSFNMFLLAWAAAVRGGPAPPSPSFRRSLLAPRHHLTPPCTTGTLADRLFVPVSRAPPLPETTAANRIYRIAAADVAALQTAAGPGRTKLEAFTAHLWGLHAEAASRRRISSCCMGVVVDGRSRISPGDMAAYFGNVLSIPYGVLGSEELRRMELAEVAGEVHRWVAEAAKGEHFRELVEWVEARRPEPTVARAYLGRGEGGEEATACVVSSGMRLAVGEVDFGWGRPAFASYHFPWPGGAGYVMPMPSARGDGDWVVYVHVAPEVVEAMEEEPTVFRALDSGYMFGRRLKRTKRSCPTCSSWRSLKDDGFRILAAALAASPDSRLTFSLLTHVGLRLLLAEYRQAQLHNVYYSITLSAVGAPNIPRVAIASAGLVCVVRARAPPNVDAAPLLNWRASLARSHDDLARAYHMHWFDECWIPLTLAVPSSSIERRHAAGAGPLIWQRERERALSGWLPVFVAVTIRHVDLIDIDRLLAAGTTYTRIYLAVFVELWRPHLLHVKSTPHHTHAHGLAQKSERASEVTSKTIYSILPARWLACCAVGAWRDGRPDVNWLLGSVQLPAALEPERRLRRQAYALCHGQYGGPKSYTSYNPSPSGVDRNMVNEATTKEHGGGHEVTVTVAPALPVQQGHRLELSNLDLLLPPLDVSLFFCYLQPAPTTAALKEALAKTLVPYYPLAGEVVANADGEPELLCSGRGVDFTVANAAAGVELREVRIGAVDESVERLVPANAKKPGSVVTKFACGGAVVGCTFDHRVCDAYSFNMFLVAWAAAARGSPPQPVPSFRRSLVAPRNPPPPRSPSTVALIDRLFSPRSAAPPPPPSVAATAVNRIYRIAAADVAALKAAAGPGRTKMEAFTAHLWKLCSMAASPRRSQQCCMGVVVDGRTRIVVSPNDGASTAMRGYFGNVLTIPYGVLGTEELRRMELAEVAGDVHRWVAEAATDDHFRGLVDWVEALRPKPAAARAYLGGTGGSDAMACIVSSGMSFPVGEVDFGWGLPAFASYHFPWPAGAGYVMPMPSARGDGDWVVYVHVAPELAKVMEEEPTVFRALENSYVFQ
ncbi:hypothetical protein HU200_050828 [Digitaria exilis]|uniref:Uncharacterized protein n=1 Tax=Digitaria exilis TaxID=1010633 RepID=A0A835E8R0_9POAL|nr:hypothetical protein HU200_050828 [Digitaria exilis]